MNKTRTLIGAGLVGLASITYALLPANTIVTSPEEVRKDKKTEFSITKNASSDYLYVADEDTLISVDIRIIGFAQNSYLVNKSVGLDDAGSFQGFRFNLNGFPDGVYQFDAKAEDIFGNIETQKLDVVMYQGRSKN